MIQHFVKGMIFEILKPSQFAMFIIFVVSYLKTLLIPFNEMVNKFLDQMQPLANGSTIVPMKVHFGEFTQDVISKVCQLRLLSFLLAKQHTSLTCIVVSQLTNFFRLHLVQTSPNNGKIRI